MRTWTFLVVVFALAVPFWVFGAVSGLQLLPGLPIAALMFICPAVAALILVGPRERVRLLARAIDIRGLRPRWVAVALLLVPAILVASWLSLRIAPSATAMPLPTFSVWRPFVLFAAFLVAALGEELGWTAFLVERLGTVGWHGVRVGIVVGVAWAAIHVVPFIEGGRDVAWIVWQCLFTVANRVLLVWLYERTERNVLATALSHAAYNTAWLLFPVDGSLYDPRSVAIITCAVAAVAVVSSRRP